MEKYNRSEFTIDVYSNSAGSAVRIVHKPSGCVGHGDATKQSQLDGRQEAFFLIGQLITNQALLRVVRAAVDLRENVSLGAWPEVVALEEAIEALPEHLRGEGDA